MDDPYGLKTDQSFHLECNVKNFFSCVFQGYDSFTPVTRVIDGGEPMEFRCLFKNWKEKDQTTSFTNKRRISGKKNKQIYAIKTYEKMRNVITLGRTKSENINRIIPIIDDFHLVTYCQLQKYICDLIKRLITLGIDYIKRPLLCLCQFLYLVALISPLIFWPFSSFCLSRFQGLPSRTSSAMKV
jgi:hypothetical protein